MYPQTNTTVDAVDPVFYFIFGFGVIMLLGIAATMVYFVIRYNRKRCPEPTSLKDDNLWLELTWTIIPTIIVMAMFWFGWEGYLSLRRVPDNAMEVKCSARMWSWLFTYESGKTSDKLYVPVGRPVKVILTAKDVVHSFYVPAFRIKRDCVPGMETYAWFVAEEAGSYNVFCAEYCGLGHAAMITTVEALPKEEFDVWVKPDAEVLVHPGKMLLEKHLCTGCHAFDDQKRMGPSLKDMKDRQVVVITDGQERTISADRDYLVRSILNPNADIVKDFPPAMPSYEGAIPAEEMEQIIDFLMNGDKKQPPSPGAQLLEKGGCFACHSTDGSRQIGPSLKGVFNQQVTVKKDGQEITVTCDRAYLERSIREPKAEIVVGFPPVMQIMGELSDAEIKTIVDYIQSL